MSVGPSVSQQVDESVATAAGMLRTTIGARPPVNGDRSSPVTAIVLGSGLGSLADKIQSPIAIPFAKIPGFLTSTASGHRGHLVIGSLAGAPVIAMAGRLHRYEGWTNAQVTFPIRVMRALGAERLIASNAAGGVNPKLCVGDIVVITDHIDWLHARRQSPLVSTVTVPRQPAPGQPASGQLASGRPVPGQPMPGPTADGPNGANFRGDRDSDRDSDRNGVIGDVDEFLVRRKSSVYDSELADVALSAARDGAFSATKGTYLATLGPTYETRAEYRMMRQMGADVVGMSTAGEVLVAAELGMSVLALSIVSNVADPDRANVADHAEVLEAGDAAAAKLEGIVRRVLAN